MRKAINHCPGMFLLSLLFPLCLSAGNISSPQSFLEETIQNLREIGTLRASVKRFQLYNGETRISVGRVEAADSATVYNYSSPGKFRMIFTGRELLSIDLQKEQGRRKNISAHCLLKERDPLGKFLGLRNLPAEEYEFKGSVDSQTVFIRCSEEGLTEYIGIQRASLRPTVIEWFDSTGVMLEQTRFNYNTGSVIPLSIVTKSMPGSILIDSMVISHPRINSGLSDVEFQIPEEIRWDQER
ncbi:MAG: hypothetical protein GX556_14125 [Fibrobacter sp.]|nr:hypothetical protein [Fibrobacter sp.]